MHEKSHSALIGHLDEGLPNEAFDIVNYKRNYNSDIIFHLYSAQMLPKSDLLKWNPSDTEDL